jgi:type I restriction enzyme S subunit
VSVPKLRFPEFRDKDEWEELALATISDRIMEKVGSGKLQPVSISAGIGFVLQADKFGRDISGDQYINYIIISEGDFAYNKGNSKRYPQGCIYKLHEFKKVASPNAFICFRFKQEYIGDFFKQYFENNRHGYQLKKFITSGARSDGLLNIRPDDFFSISFPAPAKKEQQKIADCLSSLDDLIAAHNQKLAALKAHKKGLMQQLFPAEGQTVPKLRFPEFRDKGDWEEKAFGSLCKFVRGPFGGALTKNIFIKTGYAVYEQSHSIYADFSTFRYFISAEKYKELKRFSVEPNDIIMSCSGTMGRFAIIPLKPIAGVINQALLKLTMKPGLIVSFFKINLELPINQEKLLSQSAGGAIKNVVGVDQMKAISFMIPSLPEQQKIADCLSSLDNLITAQVQKIEALKQHKKGLMQQLFPQSSEADA